MCDFPLNVSACVAVGFDTGSRRGLSMTGAK